MKGFIPIREDLLGAYVDGLRREGFYTEDQIQEIYEKHLLANKNIKKPVYKKEVEQKIEYSPKVKNNDDYYVDFRVSKSKVKVNIVFPFKEMNEWHVKNGYKKTLPPEIYIRCLLLNGASEEYCKMWYGLHLRRERLVKNLYKM